MPDRPSAPIGDGGGRPFPPFGDGRRQPYFGSRTPLGADPGRGPPTTVFFIVPRRTAQRDVGCQPCPPSGSPYAPSGMPAPGAAGPSPARLPPPACSPLEPGSTWNRRSTSAGRPSLTTFTRHFRTTF